MQLDNKRRAEYASRRGSTGRTILQLLWFLFTGAGAYFFVRWLFTSETLTYDQIYAWGVPRTVPDIAVYAATIFLVFFVLQIFFLIGYLIASPDGRERQGKPTAKSRTPDFINGAQDWDD